MSENVEGVKIGGGREFFPVDGHVYKSFHIKHGSPSEQLNVLSIPYDGEVLFYGYWPTNSVRSHITSLEDADTEYMKSNFDKLFMEFLDKSDDIPEFTKLKLRKKSGIVNPKVMDKIMNRFNRYLREVKKLNCRSLEKSK